MDYDWEAFCREYKKTHPNWDEEAVRQAHMRYRRDRTLPDWIKKEVVHES